MSRFFRLACLGLAVALLPACGTPERKATPQAAVSGTITLDGKAMPDGEISLSIPGEPVVVLTVTGGEFAGKAFVGKNRVEVARYKEGPPLSTDPSGPPTRVNILPDRFHSATTLTAEVPAAGASGLSFAVTSR